MNYYGPGNFPYGPGPRIRIKGNASRFLNIPVYTDLWKNWFSCAALQLCLYYLPTVIK